MSGQAISTGPVLRGVPPPRPLNPTQEAAAHREAAKSLLKIRDSYIHLLADVKGNALSAKEIRNQRDHLSAQAQKVYQTAPDTSSKAYILARRALKEREDLTFSDEEIDKFLPVNLRKTAPTGTRETPARRS
ncbi:hypothetical protein ASG92_21645 [Arthrobacter sp. Soil736]|uniref:SLATT domain-containing protein n=1 Tax=Arthrobacter sp. Soil736 TaxID=1736395 RepID=UPI0006F67EB3|nr:SLATT domain-containing protein [Arthrobacter sp. Soil736]KRE60555.1 hypothetical protein ASG92_21645 [Arthrobacter sp. Soil736]